MKKLGLYLHIPFCEKKCDYCNFVSYCTSDDTKLLYVQNLMKEIVLQSQKYQDYEKQVKLRRCHRLKGRHDN